jgi:hypothetical protein
MKICNMKIFQKKMIDQEQRQVNVLQTVDGKALSVDISAILKPGVHPIFHVIFLFEDILVERLWLALYLHHVADLNHPSMTNALLAQRTFFFRMLPLLGTLPSPIRSLHDARLFPSLIALRSSQ